MKLPFSIRSAIVASALLFALNVAAVGPNGFLRVSGDKVLDPRGSTVRLKGFNVSFKHFKDVLGEEDIKRIAGTGANCIRLAIDCRDFELSPFRYREDDFRLLSRLLRWTERYGVYVILDMHLAPGIQNPHDFAFRRGKAYLFWSDKRYRERYYALLSEFAKRYGKRKNLAAYDLLNEGVPPDIRTYKAVMNRAAATIRAIDKDHILVVEEAIMTDGRKKLSLIDDDNVIYSIHFYIPGQFAGTKALTHIDKSDLLKKLKYALEFRKRSNVPLYVGEFTAHAGHSRQSLVSYLGDILQIMENGGIHWTYWEYYSDYPGIGLYSSDPALTRPDALGALERYLKVPLN